MTLRTLLETFWPLIPAGFANMAPVFAARLFPHWDYPVDFGTHFRGRRVFGGHKTFRGFVAGVVMGELAFLALRFVAFKLVPMDMRPNFTFLHIPLYAGLWIGLCALLGDLAKSFFKRQMGLEAGKSWIPFDQIDWAVGTFLGCLSFLPFSLTQALELIAAAFFLSLGAKGIGFLLKINRAPI
ncbi:MAG: CDP-archaeol synthase [Bdellovibrionota bacterium]